MEISTLQIGDVIRDRKTGERFTIATLVGYNDKYPIKFEEKSHSNWSLPYLQKNYTLVLTTTWYEIF